MDKLLECFENPPAAYRGKPFWSWNGDLDRDELLRQLDILHEMGFGGSFMHSRTGLQTEYLGNEWFSLINACADASEELGMEAWLYDEDRWPSGTAGGMVTKEPAFRMKYLTLRPVNAKDFIWSEQTVAAFTCKRQQLDLYEYAPISRQTDPDEYKGQEILQCVVIEMEKNSFYNGYTYVDTLNEEATERFIELTHEKYAQNCGLRLGCSIKGIFTDEPHRGQLMSDFGSSAGKTMTSPQWSVPWTYTLFDTFREKYGYDLQSRLPELFLNYQGQKIAQIKWHFVDLLQIMFIDHFARPIHQWCSDHQLLLTGHTLQEDSLTAQTAVVGSMMRFYEHMDYPGVDVLTEGNKNYWLVKQATSAARQLGQKWLLSELYGCTGWQMNFRSHKNVGDWQALFGINLRCHHLSWYTMQGEAKRDYPASILHQSAWWPDYKYVEDYFSRLGVMLSQGQPCCDTLVLNPIESVWAQIHPGWCSGLSAADPAIIELEQHYVDLFNWLTGAQIDFDYGDEEMISRLYRVDQDSDGRAVLYIGQASYRQVVVSGLQTIRATTLAVLREFMAAGGTVVMAGEQPAYVDALPSGQAKKALAAARQIDFTQSDLVSSCSENICRPVKLSSRDPNALESIFMQVRHDQEHLYIVLLNTDREKAFSKVGLQIDQPGYVQAWDCASGTRVSLGQSGENGFACELDFAAGGEHVLVVTDQAESHLPLREKYICKKTWAIEGPFDYTLDESNICVLDMASYRIDDGSWQPEQEILKIDQQVRDHFSLDYRSGSMIQPWYAKKTSPVVCGQLTMQFRFSAEYIPPEGFGLVMETPAQFSLMLNGQPVDTSKDDGWWVDIALKRFTLSADLMNKGENVVELQTQFNQGTNLEALYLLGQFAVSIEGSEKTLTRLPRQIKLGDLTVQGLPFYSGRICYHIQPDSSWTAHLEAEDKLFLCFDDFSGACIKVLAEDEHDQVIAWPPYQLDLSGTLRKESAISIELVLTRRNTFGPLHQVPLHTAAYGPGNFVTTGASFSDDYMLIPSGILGRPRIEVRTIQQDG